MKKELLLWPQTFYPIVTATSEMSLLFFVFLCLFGFFLIYIFHRSPVELSAAKWDSNSYHSAWSASVWPLNASTKQDPVSCCAPKGSGVTKKKTNKKKLDLSSLLCNCGGKESMIKVFINLKKKNNKKTFLYRDIFLWKYICIIKRKMDWHICKCFSFSLL